MFASMCIFLTVPDTFLMHKELTKVFPKHEYILSNLVETLVFTFSNIKNEILENFQTQVFHPTNHCFKRYGKSRERFHRDHGFLFSFSLHLYYRSVRTSSSVVGPLSFLSLYCFPKPQCQKD